MKAIDPPNISVGDYSLTADCPECRRTVVLPIALSVVLTVDEENGYVRARLSTKRVEHNCSGDGAGVVDVQLPGD